MSRIGKSPVNIPSGVNVKLDGNVITVKGSKGELTQAIDDCVTLTIEENQITFNRESDSPVHRAKHGLYLSLINNMITGVSEGYKKELEVILKKLVYSLSFVTTLCIIDWATNFYFKTE